VSPNRFLSDVRSGRYACPSVPAVVPVEQRNSLNWSQVKAVDTSGVPNYSTPLGLSPRIVVFRPFVEQLPKLGVAGSTPVPALS
jgi:hypothetical protein